MEDLKQKQELEETENDTSEELEDQEEETEEKEIPQEEETKVINQMDYLLNERNFRFELIAQFTLMRESVTLMNENITKLGKIMEDVLDAVNVE